MATEYGYTYDYTKTMMMKMGLSHPDRKGGSNVSLTFENALDIIKKLDNITQGIPKIIYLVGWQYLGHDDKYPDFFEVNESLKRPQDNTARDSLLWLMNEAKKFNTIVSFHINFNDAYDDAPSFDDFVKANALIRRKSGEIWALEKYNGKNCYKTSFKEYWESGLFKRQIDKLLELFPIEQQGTIHVDNFQCYTNYSPSVNIEEMQQYRNKMIEYLRNKGIDITTEFTYREENGMSNNANLLNNRKHNPKVPIKTLGKMPAVWWLTDLSNQELIDIQPQQLTGGILRDGTRKGIRAKFIYGNIHGEDIFAKYKCGDQVWAKAFLKDFATIQVPFNFFVPAQKSVN